MNAYSYILSHYAINRISWQIQLLTVQDCELLHTVNVDGHFCPVKFVHIYMD